MNTIRTLTLWFAATAALAGLGRLPTAGLELLAQPADLVGWWDRHGTDAAAVSILHLAALAATTYVVIVVTLIGLAQTARLPHLARSTARFAPATVRRHLVIGVVAGAVAVPTSVAAQEPLALTDTGPAASREAIVLVDLGPAPTDPADPSPSPSLDGAAPSTFRESFRAADTAATPDAWLVERGDDLWTIAVSVLTDAGEHADDERVWRYWRDLIDANRERVGNPDLIHPGQVLTLPPVITAGS